MIILPLDAIASEQCLIGGALLSVREYPLTHGSTWCVQDGTDRTWVQSAAEARLLYRRLCASYRAEGHVVTERLSGESLSAFADRHEARLGEPQSAAEVAA